MKKLSILLVLLLAGIAFGQQQDRWNSLVIDETTPEQAITLLGKPKSEIKSNYVNADFYRLLSIETGKEIFRVLNFGDEGIETRIMLTFSGGKLVAIDAYPKDFAASELVSKLGTNWRLPVEDAATDLENWDQPRSAEIRKAPTVVKNFWLPVYTLLAKTPKVFAVVAVSPTRNDMKKTEVSESGPYWGNVWSLSIVSRTLVRKPGDPESGDGPIPAGTEVVMAPDSSITAETSTGTITITAGKGLLRSYTWEGATRFIEMYVSSTRKSGSPGLFFPGAHNPPWKMHNGINGGDLKEGEMRFPTVAAAMKWINARSKSLPMVYRNDGLLVGFGKTLPRKELNVEMWQIYINGKKPKTLAGSQDAKIR